VAQRRKKDASARRPIFPLSCSARALRRGSRTPSRPRGCRLACVLVEVLTFEGCPHAAPAVELAQRVVREAGGDAEVGVVTVAEGATEAMRFLGSPSIRVNGVDVEPGAQSRRAFAHGCRLYPTPTGLRPLPLEEWVREALEHH
jgi:hypothetical protein